MKLIDKDALVAEIEKCYNECLKKAKITESNYWNAKADAYRNVWVILNDTLEVKEMELEKEIDKWWWGKTWQTYGMVLNPYNVRDFAKHFFELGMQISNKIQKGE